MFPADRLGMTAVRDGPFEHAAQRLAALGQSLNRREAVHEYRPRERVLEVKCAEPAPVLLGSGLAVKGHLAAQKELRQTMPAAHQASAQRKKLALHQDLSICRHCGGAGDRIRTGDPLFTRPSRRPEGNRA